MAKINHNSFVNTINNIVNQAKTEGIIHLDFNGETWKGAEMQIGDRSLVNFGTCGYLGLETNPKLIENAIEYTKRYGTQFSISRAYVSSKVNNDLEDVLSQIFDGCKTIVFSSTTLAHIAMFPLVVEPNDLIILDQQAHVSMQTGAQLVAAKGTAIEIIRHNSMEMLERKIQQYDNKINKIWYVLDGVYSMYGDLPPFDELNVLSKKYPKLHFYVDDAHGMSWAGNNGSGCAFGKFKDNEKTILVSTMAKGFGSIGGIVVFPNDEWYERVKMHGGPLAYSHPLAPSIIGASLASAEIHLSNDLISLQNELRSRIEYCNKLLAQTDIPVLSNPSTPIYFLGTGQPNVGYNLNKRILKEGFYVNIGMFPAVPVKNTGLRFTMTNHVSLKDVENFVAALSYHYPKALEDENRTNNQVRKAFKMPYLEGKKALVQKKDSEDLTISIFHSINEIDEQIWNELSSENVMCTHSQLKMNEEAFQGNDLIEENMKMYYFIVTKEATDQIVCATLFSQILLKDDVFSEASKSILVENVREKNPYFLTSNYLMMGTMLTEGNHLFVKDARFLEQSLDLILKELSGIQEKNDVNTILLRDLDSENQQLSKYLNGKGFARFDMPNGNIIPDLPKSESGLVETLSKSSKQNFKRYIKKFEDHFYVEIKDTLDEDEMKVFKKSQNELTDKNFAVNLFRYPSKFFESSNRNQAWEFIILKNKEFEIVSIGSALKVGSSYVPVLIGLKTITKVKVYHQMLFQAVKRAISLGCNKVHLGLTADSAKKDVGAHQVSRVGFIQSKDNYNFEVIENFRLTNE